ncbi:MAG: hypothetical protein M1816_000304 [Peltula sp. TS41687]|nr:MAG: hypothetical protein M1816_000304 [Peltula sp. TS41687]
MDPLKENAIHHERFVKIICVGAGISGLCLAYKLRQSFEDYSLTIYEKNPELGGTWYENKYPGCACDVPSHNYTFSFEPKNNFTSVLASWSEIKGYFNDFATKYDLRNHIKTSHLVSQTSWDQTEGKWNVTAIDSTTGETIHDWCHILVHATGYLNKLAWPKAPGLEIFKGPKLHSAAWDDSVPLEGKNILLIGSGGSAIQILPAVQPLVKSAKVFMRTPRWTLPSASGKSGKFSDGEMEKFRTDPDAVLNLRLENERTLNSFFTMYMKGTVLQQQARALLDKEMKKLIIDPEAQKRLVPTFPVGCKRILPSGFPFLRTLREPNVQPIYFGVKSFTETGCISEDGQSHEGDIIICASGFDMSYISRYPIVFNGRNLQDDWSSSISGYMGVAISECPNTFTLAGPWSPTVNGSVIPCIEAQSDYICSFIDKYQTEPELHSISLKAAASQDFKAYVAQATKRMVWSEDCGNSHNIKENWGQSSIGWPGSTLHYLEAIREPRFEDFEFQYSGNRFSWMGDGVSQTEWDATADLAYYIRNEDDGKHLSRAARRRIITKSGILPPRELHRQARLSSADP